MVRREEMNAARAVLPPVRVIPIHRHALRLLPATRAVATLAAVARRRTLLTLFVPGGRSPVRRRPFAVLLASIGATRRRRRFIRRRWSVCFRFRRWRRRWGRGRGRWWWRTGRQSRRG